MDVERSGSGSASSTGGGLGRAERRRIPDERLEKTLGRAVHERRGRTVMTQSRLAELSGLTQAAISRLEHGKCMPAFPLLERIAQAFGSPLLVAVEPGRGVTVSFDGGDRVQR
ncbi:helix-turn-helix transcriptional regulator [Streptomyces sp. NPDC052301]|uniref:helix-turn-helix transcriptional regulator n=1 Tax=Streptomyces sp. NPDC052301 TaxID=3365687 RepID=UPI0037D45725